MKWSKFVNFTNNLNAISWIVSLTIMVGGAGVYAGYCIKDKIDEKRQELDW